MIIKFKPVLLGPGLRSAAVSGTFILLFIGEYLWCWPISHLLDHMNFGCTIWCGWLVFLWWWSGGWWVVFPALLLSTLYSVSYYYYLFPFLLEIPMYPLSFHFWLCMASGEKFGALVVEMVHHITMVSFAFILNSHYLGYCLSSYQVYLSYVLPKIKITKYLFLDLGLGITHISTCILILDMIL